MVHHGTCFREFLSFRIQLFWLWQEQSALKRPGAAKSSKEFKWKAAHFRRLVVVGKRETRQLSPANASCVERCSVCHRQMGMGQVGDVRDSLPRISLPNMPSTCWLYDVIACFMFLLWPIFVFSTAHAIASFACPRRVDPEHRNLQWFCNVPNFNGIPCIHKLNDLQDLHHQ